MTKEPGGSCGVSVAEGGNGQARSQSGMLGVVEAGLLQDEAGLVRLLKFKELIGQLEEVVRRTSGDAENLGAMMKRFAGFSATGVELGESLVGERLVGIDLQGFLQGPEGGLLLFVIKLEEAEPGSQVQGIGLEFQMFLEHADGFSEAASLAVVVRGAAGGHRDLHAGFNGFLCDVLKSFL